MKVREQVHGAAWNRAQVSWSSQHPRVLLPEPYQPLGWFLELGSPCTVLCKQKRNTAASR